MSREKIEMIAEKLKGIKQEISAMPESSANGQIIDAESHIRNAYTHLEQYLRITARLRQ